MYVDAEIPFTTLGNQLVITDHTLMENPWLIEFISRFENCFERNAVLECYMFYPGGKPGCQG